MSFNPGDKQQVKTRSNENDPRLNRKRMKRFQKWDRIEKPRRPCDNPS